MSTKDTLVCVIEGDTREGFGHVQSARLAVSDIYEKYREVHDVLVQAIGALQELESRAWTRMQEELPDDFKPGPLAVDLRSMELWRMKPEATDSNLPVLTLESMVRQVTGDIVDLH